MANGAVAISRARCSCASVVFHLPGCWLLRGEAPDATEAIRCDTEDGCVWLHLGEAFAPMSPKRARDLGDELHACAREAEKKR